MIVKPHAWHCKRGRGLESDWHVLMYYQTSCSGFPQRIPKPNFILTLIKVDFWDGFDISHTHTHRHTSKKSLLLNVTVYLMQHLQRLKRVETGGWVRAHRQFHLKGTRTSLLHNVTTAQQSCLYRRDALKHGINSIHPEPEAMAGRRMGRRRGKKINLAISRHGFVTPQCPPSF